MSEHGAETQPEGSGGPVAPPKPNVAAFGKKGGRGRMLADVIGGAAAPAAVPPQPRPIPQVTAEPPPAHPPAAPTPAASEATAAPPVSTEPVPAVEPTPTTAPPPTVPSQAPGAAGTSVTVKSHEPASPINPTVSSVVPGESVDDADEMTDGTLGKLPQQVYVPDAVAAKFRRMQKSGSGVSAELIVLTAVNNAAQRMPELIKAARGPVQSGLFPGLPVLDDKGKRDVEPNDRRIQFQLSAKYQGPIKALMNHHKLSLSAVVRLALGDYFGVPVRLDRTL